MNLFGRPETVTKKVAKKTGAKENTKETRTRERIMHESFWLSIDGD